MLSERYYKLLLKTLTARTRSGEFEWVADDNGWRCGDMRLSKCGALTVGKVGVRNSATAQLCVLLEDAATEARYAVFATDLQSAMDRAAKRVVLIKPRIPAWIILMVLSAWLPLFWFLWRRFIG